jgi:hypothetical protein
MTELRRLRRTSGLSQQAFAAALDVPLNTFRMRDSGLRTLQRIFSFGRSAPLSRDVGDRSCSRWTCSPQKSAWTNVRFETRCVLQSTARQ